MQTLLQDFRFSLRLLAKTPGFTAAALLTLALGANSAVFSLINAAILKPIVAHKPEELVSVYNASHGADRGYRRFSLAEFQVLQTPNEVFSDVAAMAPARAGISLIREQSPQRSLVHLTTANYFSLLDTTPAQGRFFDASEAQPNAAIPVVIASHNLWQRLGARADFLGSTLWVNGQACTVIGIAREGFSGATVFAGPELWLPLGMFSHISSAFTRARLNADLTKPGNASLLVVARMQPSLDVASASARLAPLSKAISDLQPSGATNPRELQISSPSRLNFSTEPVNNSELMLLALPLVFMAGCVLLIACLNLANMFLARGTTRAKEIAVRLALGATRWQIVRQLFVEGMVLSIAGGAAGLVLSFWGNHALVTALTTAMQKMVNISIVLDPRPDLLALGCTFAACVGATLVFSLAPALRSSRLDVVSALKSGSEPVTGGWNRLFTGRHLLVMAQITVSLVLLFSAGLFLRGALKANTIPLGFEASDGVVTELDFSLRNSAVADDQRNLAAILERLKALPSVANAAVTTQAPMCNTEDSRHVLAFQSTDDAPGSGIARPGTSSFFAGITPDYFATITVPLLQGRDFTEIESRAADSPRVAIIDTSLAKKLFPAGDALGQRIRFTGAPSGDSGYEVVGIVAEHRHEILEVNPTYRVFVPLVNGYRGNAHVQTRSRDARRESVIAMAATVRAEIQQFDPTLPVLQHEPFADFIDRDNSLWSARLGAVVFGIFGSIALLLAVIGVYSVKAFAIACRTREFGIRSALGAQPGDVLSLVMKEGAKQVALASAIGIGLALLVGQMLTSLLFHISPADPLALGGATAVLAIAAMLACYFPARRATEVSPLTALRSE